MTAMTGKAFWQNGLLFAVSCGVSLLVAEAVVATFFPQNLGTWGMTRDGITSHIPNLSVYLTQFKQEISINSHGMRDREHAVAKEPGTTRILVLGDSFMEANQVAFKDSFSSLLEARLKSETSGQVEVINAGVSGWGTDDELTYLTRYGFRLHPDLVLVGMTLHNDIQDNLMEEFHSYADGDLREKPVEEIHPVSFVLLQVKEFLASHSHLYQVLLRAARGSWIKNEEKRLNTHVGGLLEKEQTVSMKRGWHMTQLLFRKMKQKSAEIGAPVMVFLIPLRIQISERNLQRFLEDHDITRDQIVWDQPQRTMRQIGSVEGLMVMDLLADFREKEEMVPDQLYLAGDGHWTAAGHRLASELVANKLIKSGVLPPSNPSH